MTEPWNKDGPAYRGHTKHKNRPNDEVKGTFCPNWTHDNEEGGFAGDVYQHHWPTTLAADLFAKSEPDPRNPGRRYATAKGVAFEAKPTNDGTWHGFPVPWEAIPAPLIRAWRKTGKVTGREIRRYLKRDKDDIRWALETD